MFADSMRILIVCPKLNHGGAERVAVCLANGFVIGGHEVTVASNLYEEATYELNQQVHVCNLVGKSKNPLLKWLSAILFLRSHLKTNKPDVIIGIMQLCSLVAKLAAIDMHIPIVMTEHDSFERPLSAPFTTMQRFSKFYLNKIYKHVTVLTSADKALADKMLKHITVMPNPLATPIVSESEINNVLSKKKNIILASGRLYDWHYKGLDVLIRAWGQINRNKTIDNGRLIMDNGQFGVQSSTLTGWKLQIAGVGSADDIFFLKKLCKENEVEESVDFLGFVSDVQLLYQKASIFVLSSRYEGFGLVLIEAMSQGCACIACDYKGRQREIFEELKNEGIEELKNGSVEVCENGILCEPDNVEALASALEKMIDDDAYRESVRTHAIERSKYYDMEHTMKRWEEYLNTIVNIK